MGKGCMSHPQPDHEREQLVAEAQYHRDRFQLYRINKRGQPAPQKEMPGNGPGIQR